MTDLRALLKRLEWAGMPQLRSGTMLTDSSCPSCHGCPMRLDVFPHGGHAPDCELAAAIAEPNVTGSGLRGLFMEFHDWYQNVAWKEDPECGTHMSVAIEKFLARLPPPAPHVKVTEVEGTYRSVAYEESFISPDGPGTLSLDDLMPPECVPALYEDGPHGRFRVTVEFTPGKQAPGRVWPTECPTCHCALHHEESCSVCGWKEPA